MEYVRRWTVCGKIYCYTDQDLKNNQERVNNMIWNFGVV